MGVMDALWRIFATMCILSYNLEGVQSPFKNLSILQKFKILVVRFGIQFAAQLATVSTILLSASTNAVIRQMQIPLVALISFLIYRAKLSRNQLLFVLAIIPVSIQFNLIGEEDGPAKHWIGYVVAIGGTVMEATSNVFAEYILKDELKNRSTWNKQFTFAMFDLPVMLSIWFVFTATEIYWFKIECRSWNPLSANELANMHWIILLGLNGGSWGFCRLGILNDADALWFNMSQVFVLTILWVVDVIREPKQFDILKMLAVMTLTVTLTGYELVSRDRQLETEMRETISSKKVFSQKDVKEIEVSDISEKPTS